MKKIKILVLSEGPPPIGDALVEGGGLRAWGITASLAQKGHTVTYAYRFTFKRPKVASKAPRNVSIAQWSPDNIQELVNEHSHIVLRYSMGEMGLFIDSLSSRHILIADCYIPISVEVSARDGKNLDREVNNYISETYWWQRCIKRSDYILYASVQQLNYYLGYLSAILKLNPASYSLLEGRLLKLPYGYFKKDIQKESSGNKQPALVWYGGIYPWFDMGPIVEAAKLIKKEIPEFKMIIAGAKNPYTDNKDFLEHYNMSMRKIAEISSFTEIIGHTSYSDRFKVYSKGSTIITLNKEGLENNLAWRTRLADYIASRQPIITNGGDPLGELAIENGNAIKISDIHSPESIKVAFKESLNLHIYSDNTLVNEMTWEHNINTLNSILQDSSRLDPRLTDIDLSLLKPKNNFVKLHEGFSYSKLVLREQGVVALIRKLLQKGLLKLKPSK